MFYDSVMEWYAFASGLQEAHQGNMEKVRKELMKSQHFITYTHDIEGITASMLGGGFFDGWPNCPSAEKHLEILKRGYRVIVAIDQEKHQVIGFIQAISDGILSAYIPLIEVLPAYQGQGIGRELVRRMKKELAHLYMVDLICDPELQPFYEKEGMIRVQGMVWRNYDKQSGE